MSIESLKLGIVGNPLSHSKSPQMQEAGLKQLELSGEYKKYEIEQEDFSEKFKALLETVDGLNITIPYKESVLNYLHKKDSLVERIGACNTISIKNGEISGYNTDYHGFKESLVDSKTKQNLDLKGKKAALLGAGGAAKAVIIALADLGLAQLDIYVRNTKKAQSSIQDMDIGEMQLNLKLLSNEASFEGVSLLINSTPIGQGRLVESMPVEEEQLKSLDSDATVYDLIYSKTKLLQEAENLKLKTIDGSMMLVMQGVEALNIWTNSKANDELIRIMEQAFRE